MIAIEKLLLKPAKDWPSPAAAAPPLGHDDVVPPSILVVGAGPVGLFAALDACLAWGVAPEEDSMISKSRKIYELSMH